MPKPETPEEMDSQVLEYIKRYYDVTCVELSNRFGSGEGYITQGQNVIVAFGLSADLCASLVRLTQANKIMLVPSRWLTYVMAGSIIQIPEAKRTPSCGYTSPHWLISNYMTYDNGRQRIHMR